MRKTDIILTILALIMFSCEEIIDDTRMSSSSELIVVEGILTNERINHRIKLTRPYNAQNGDAAPVTGSLVRITNGEDTVTLTEYPAESGEYYTPLGRAVYGETYTLIIEYKGKRYYASDSAQPVEPMDEIAIAQHDGTFSLVVNPSGDEPNFINHSLDWSSTSACEGTCVGKVVFYDLKTVDVNEFYKPRDERFTFPENTLIIRKKYSVSPAFKGYLRAMMSETRWRGGVFDVERDNVPTNLSEGATGFFAVSTVVSDTTIVKK
jgi:hypothetical protein